MPKVAFTTLGCRLNQAGSDSMAEELAASGLDTAAADEAPDVVVVNTCTVTREATKASRMAIRRAVRAHPDAKVVVAGCYAVSDPDEVRADRKSTRLNSSHLVISYAVFCLKKKKIEWDIQEER